MKDYRMQSISQVGNNKYYFGKSSSGEKNQPHNKAVSILFMKSNSCSRKSFNSTLLRKNKSKKESSHMKLLN
jgi:hypothetical protein